MYRYGTAANLERWLASKERRDLLAEGEKFSDFELRTVDNSFGSWFPFDQHGRQAPPPSDLKTSIAVWVGLYQALVAPATGRAGVADQLARHRRHRCRHVVLGTDVLSCDRGLLAPAVSMEG